jgi:hypothetical protein
LSAEPQAAVGKDNDDLPVATGLPRTWDEIAPGHLVIAQEALEYGWWEAVVIARNRDMLTLRFRDYDHDGGVPGRPPSPSSKTMGLPTAC